MTTEELKAKAEEIIGSHEIIFNGGIQKMKVVDAMLDFHNSLSHKEELPPISKCIDADAPYEDMNEEFKKGFDFCLSMVRHFEKDEWHTDGFNGLVDDCGNVTSQSTEEDLEASGNNNEVASVATLHSDSSNPIEHILGHIRKKAKTNERKWDRAQTTKDKIRFGTRARMCKELLNELSVMLNNQQGVQGSVATKLNQGNAADQQKEVDTEFVYIPVSVEKELPPSRKDVFCLDSEHEYLHQNRYIPEINEWFDVTEDRYQEFKRITHWLKKLPITSISKAIDWEGLEKAFYNECCSRRILWKGTPATNINTKEIIEWLKTNLTKYIK